MSHSSKRAFQYQSALIDRLLYYHMHQIVVNLMKCGPSGHRIVCELLNYASRVTLQPPVMEFLQAYN